MVQLKMYNDTYWELLDCPDDIFYLHEYKSSLKKFSKSSPGEIERVSRSRTKRRIREICLCNDFEYFVTMTVSSKIPEYNRFELENCVDNCKKFMHRLKRKSVDFKYIFVIEEHKKGGYHFHGMMKNLPKGDIYTNDKGYLSSHILDELGYNSFSIVDNYNACCNYITKYICKNPVITAQNQIYFCSRGLKNPQTEIMIPVNIDKIFGDNYSNTYKGEYCKKCSFDITRLSPQQQYELNAYFNENDEFFKNDNNYITNRLKLFTNFSKYGKLKIIQ